MVTKSAPTPQDATAEMQFEQILERLKSLVEKLETGDLPLEDSLKLFEEGIALARAGSTRLDEAELRVEKLLSADEGKEPRVEKIDVSSDE